MADPLYELLIPYFDAHDAHSRPTLTDAVTSAYLSRLTTLPLAALTSSEQQSLSQSSQSILRSLQALSKRSHRSIISSSDHLSRLRHVLPTIGQDAGTVQTELPKLETAAHNFSQKYSKSAENPILDRRRKAMLLARNIDRVSDVLDLPTLLSSAISSSTVPTQASAASTSTTNANYASALDLHAHIKRLYTLYPNSHLISTLSSQAEHEMKAMTSNLIASLQSHGIKLAGAMRTIGWLRRVAPELDESWSTRQTNIGSGEGSLGALFLVCRLACLESMLSALDPLRELADQETEKRVNGKAKGDAGWAVGQQTEKYLKKYLEVFREQSFAIISMYKSIFPSALPAPGSDEASAPAVKPATKGANPLQPIPSALATFPLHLVEMLFDTLRAYLPNVQDRSSRDSLLTQVLYCAGSLGRLGGDFSMMIALLEEDLRAAMEEEEEVEENEAEEEWVDVMKKHRVQASRLELLASGVGTGRTTSPVDRIISPGH
ncbi:Dor1-domain-containing protein [Trematosphaeria pertusa]|uniref:Conserved oligomeric Golgi complex subunit 8 n=1 Tax=Trematosphaeria pertusa TaxID=390896 RepID=A0A6A6IJR6_9PLEO|nr:Dor1-domain-containing protein [Trematosphaeria pertusa]KAF2249810.1 Dor1-domain-containing protein [Trematosphaeria pertusa]